ncbi:response regulator [Neptuniibacter halophilus]|uniref:response regulator n=1 Tax=Neptuniibacter halophilus TaxID=651666 RepID=UPI0025727C8A|nr:response regulator [Neptuniibacter halophilus]
MSKTQRTINVPPASAVVLIVDDMQSMRMLTRTTLKSMGFRRIVESPNGEEALKRLRLMNIDLIICDWDMPQMNGLELLRNLRADQRLNRIPFIMLTAHAEAHLIHESIATGVDSYLVKPYQPTALCSRVNTLLKTPG